MSKPRHTCITDDGGTPNRRCEACATESKYKADPPVGDVSPCVCRVDDGLVQEWVSKARAVAKSKGFIVAVGDVERRASELPKIVADWMMRNDAVLIGLPHKGWMRAPSQNPAVASWLTQFAKAVLTAHAPTLGDVEPVKQGDEDKT